MEIQSRATVWQLIQATKSVVQARCYCRANQSGIRLDWRVSWFQTTRRRPVLLSEHTFRRQPSVTGLWKGCSSPARNRQQAPNRDSNFQQAILYWPDIRRGLWCQDLGPYFRQTPRSHITTRGNSWPASSAVRLCTRTPGRTRACFERRHPNEIAGANADRSAPAPGVARDA